MPLRIETRRIKADIVVLDISGSMMIIATEEPPPLAALATEAGGSPRHTGGKFWTSQSDPEFLILSEWVRRRR